MNLYAWKKDDTHAGVSKTERTGTNTARTDWVTKKAALVVKY